MKKLISIVLALALCLSLCITAMAAESSNAVTATPTRQKVLFNGEEVVFEMYNINGYNFVKLRDLAYLLNGTNKQIEVAWDGARNTILLVYDKPYTAYGTELAKGDGLPKTAVPCTSSIRLNGIPVELTAYNINGNNYFKLRELGNCFCFEIAWDSATNTAILDTSKDVWNLQPYIDRRGNYYDAEGNVTPHPKHTYEETIYEINYYLDNFRVIVDYSDFDEEDLEELDENIEVVRNDPESVLGSTMRDYQNGYRSLEFLQFDIYAFLGCGGFGTQKITIQ